MTLLARMRERLRAPFLVGTAPRAGGWLPASPWALCGWSAFPYTVGSWTTTGAFDHYGGWLEFLHGACSKLIVVPVFAKAPVHAYPPREQKETYVMEVERDTWRGGDQGEKRILLGVLFLLVCNVGVGGLPLQPDDA